MEEQKYGQSVQAWLEILTNEQNDKLHVIVSELETILNRIWSTVTNGNETRKSDSIALLRYIEPILGDVNSPNMRKFVRMLIVKCYMDLLHCHESFSHNEQVLEYLLTSPTKLDPVYRDAWIIPYCRDVQYELTDNEARRLANMLPYCTLKQYLTNHHKQITFDYSPAEMRSSALVARFIRKEYKDLITKLFLNPK